MAAGASGVSAGGAAAPAASGGGEGGSASEGVQSVFEAVDGVGAEPKFGMEDFGIDGAGNPLEGRKVRAKPAPKPQKQSAEGSPISAAGDNLQVPGGLETENSWSSEAAKIFESELGLEKKDQGEGDPEDIEQTEGEEKPNDRFQSLIARRKEAEAKAQQLEQASQRQQQEFGQFRQQVGGVVNQLQQQNARLAAQVEMLVKGQGRNAEPEDDVTRARRELTSEAERNVFDKHIKPMQERYEAQQRAFQQAQQKHQTQLKSQEYLTQARNAAQQVGMVGLDPEVAKELLPGFEEQVLSVAWGQRTDMESAAKIVRQRHLRFGLAFVKAQANANKQRLDQVKNEVPQNTPASRAPSARGGDSLPPWNVLTANGYRSYSDWQFEGSPPLKYPGQ